MMVGIDLGTTYSAVARYDPSMRSAEIVPNREGMLLTPTVVCTDGGSGIIGDAAADMLRRGIPGCAADFKKHIGRQESSGPGQSAAELARIMYSQLAAAAEETAGERIEGAVLTVPAYFDDVQRCAVIDAAKDAGIEVVRVLNEPTAAALFYGRRYSGDRTVLVYDFGGGTTDITLCRLTDRGTEILATAGNSDIGGNRWDVMLLSHMSALFEDEFGVSPADDPAVREDLLFRAEAYKRLLSEKDSVEYSMEYGGMTAVRTIRRSDLESMCRPLLE